MCFDEAGYYFSTAGLLVKLCIHVYLHIHNIHLQYLWIYSEKV